MGRRRRRCNLPHRKAQARPAAGKSIQEISAGFTFPSAVAAVVSMANRRRQPHFGDVDMKTLIAALTLGTLVAAPAFAQSNNPDFGRRSQAAHKAYGAVTPFGPPTDPRNRQNSGSLVRDAAVHECSLSSRRYLETTWGSMQIFQFRACMMVHGQGE